jgi:hypothetical protein
MDKTESTKSLEQLGWNTAGWFWKEKQWSALIRNITVKNILVFNAL